MQGLGKSHRIALAPTNRQATRMRAHAEWARVAANRARGRFRPAWFGNADERNADAWYARVAIAPAPDGTLAGPGAQLVEPEDRGGNSHYQEVKALLAERIRPSVGTAPPRTRVAGACNTAPINRE